MKFTTQRWMILPILFLCSILQAQTNLLLLGAGGTGGGGGCSLSYTTGLSLWVKADTGLTCTGGCTGTNTVTAWADQSGNSNNLTTSGSTLSYAAASINGLPAVHFPGGASTPNPSSFTLTTGLTPTSVTVFVVAQASTSSTSRNAITSGPATSLEYALDSPTGPTNLQQAVSTFNAILASGTAASDNSYHQLNFTGISGTSQAFRVGRAADGSGSSATTFAGAAMTTIGYNVATGACADANACESLVGNIAELLIYSAALSGPNNTTVENYLNCRYGL